MKMSHRHAFLLTLLLSALLVPGLAAQNPVESKPTEKTAQENCDTSLDRGVDQAYDAQVFASPLSIALASSGDRDKDANGRCYVRINCANGSTRSCWGTSCSGTDQSCPSGAGGTCWGSSSGSRSCSSCPTSCTKTVTADCSNAGGGTVSCTGDCANSFAIDGCYAYCNGNFNFCPNPDNPCPF